MEQIIIATSNAGKVNEFRIALKDYEVLCLKDIGFDDDIEENGSTFIENALIKAKTVSKWLQSKGINVPVVADDSGLCVDALNGDPGIYSARYAGDHAGIENAVKLLKELEGETNRKAHYTSAIVEYYPNGEYLVVEDYTYGYILKEMVGELNPKLPYDTIFYSEELDKPASLATIEEKNSVSHRIKAMKRLLKLKQQKQN